MSMHIMPHSNAYTADSPAVDVDTKKKRCRLLAYRSPLELVRILHCVRIREEIAQSEPDLAIVRVLCERLRIIQPPGTDGASL